jgi:hypothetical protein
MASKRAMWTFGVLAAGLTTTAVITLQTSRTPASAQPSGIAGLSTAQLTRLQGMQGEYAYESGTSGPTLWKAVEAGTIGLDSAQARRTRAQLEQLLTPPPRIALALEAGSAGAPSLAIEEGRVRSAASLNGEARAIVPKGARADSEPLQLSQQLQGATLLRTIDGNGFHQERRFIASADGTQLTLQIRVSGAALSSPLSASAVYRRLQH